MGFVRLRETVCFSWHSFVFGVCRAVSGDYGSGREEQREQMANHGSGIKHLHVRTAKGSED